MQEMGTQYRQRPWVTRLAARTWFPVGQAALSACRIVAGLPRSCEVSSRSSGSFVICFFTGQPGSDLAGEIGETVTEGAVLLDGGAQFLGSRVFAMPGGEQ
jgi:hypothetical protein